MPALDGFEQQSVTYDGVTHPVFRAGSGPAVIVIHEIPGLHPGVIAFARRVVAAGYTVYAPSLFGEPGREVTAGYTAKSISRACVTREFTRWATRETSPVTTWLRQLARDAHAACGGPGVGAVGMCLTGGLALAMMVDTTMVAPVLSQPSIPFPVTAKHRRDIGVSDADLVTIKRRVAGGACVMGLRFTGDRLVPEARFDRLREELGDGFIAIEIDSSPGNPHGIQRVAPSVLSPHFVDSPGHPTRDALDRVLAFFRERLVANA